MLSLSTLLVILILVFFSTEMPVSQNTLGTGGPSRTLSPASSASFPILTVRHKITHLCFSDVHSFLHKLTIMYCICKLTGAREVHKESR